MKGQKEGQKKGRKNIEGWNKGRILKQGRTDIEGRKEGY